LSQMLPSEVVAKANKMAAIAARNMLASLFILYTSNPVVKRFKSK
jgi:hypothetical protein